MDIHNIRIIKFNDVNISCDIYSMGNMPKNKVVLVSVLTPDGKYIGTIEEYLEYRSIYNIDTFYVRKPEHNTCTLGFSNKSQKWYGFNHRSILGFGIGSKITPHDLGYNPDNFQEYSSECTNKDYTDVMVGDRCLLTGLLCYEGNCTLYSKGRGSFQAKTLQDCYSMAYDFAEALS